MGGGDHLRPKERQDLRRLRVADPDRPGTLFLKGYVLGITWLGRSTTWTEEKTARE